MRGLLTAILITLLACPLRAGTVTWGNQAIGVLDIPVTDIVTTVISELPLPLSEVRALDIKAQALLVNEMLDRWLALYAQLETPTLYTGNRFAAKARSIRWKAEREGVTDEVLSECAAFKAELAKFTSGETKPAR